MRLLRLECNGFRCLSDIRFEPTPGINVVRGKNAQGKTSLLEAILFAATSRSHRTNTESELVARQQEGFHIALHAQRSDRDVAIEAGWFKGVKRLKVNGIAQTRVSHVLGKISVILFTPEDIALVKGAASVRRKFIDMALSQLRPNYLAALQNYRHALRQRNELLRTHPHDPDMLDAWDGQLAQSGTVLIQERSAFLEQLSVLGSDLYAAIAGGESLRIEYRADVPDGESLVEALTASRSQDLRQGRTSRGPHRDDLELVVAERPARNQASQGQQKTAALALKLAEVQWVHRETGEYPILMLDEVLSELDLERAEQLFNTIDSEVQCILTTTELTAGKPIFPGDTQDFLMESGRLRPISR